MKRVLLIVLLALGSLITFSQSNKFGKVTDSQWALTSCDFDPTAKTVVLFDVGDITIEGKENPKNIDAECPLKVDYYGIVFSRQLRLKILNKVDSLKFSFTLRSVEGKNDFLKSFKGLSQLQVNGDISKTKFSQKNLKKVLSENNGCIMILNLSDVKEGSVIDIEYMIGSNIYSELPTWYFTNDYPTIYSEINYSIPDFFDINKVSPVLNKLNNETNSLDFKYRVTYETANGSNDKVYSYKYNNEKYFLKNVKSSKDMNESYVLKYVVRSINTNSVSSKSETWRFSR